MASNSLQSLHHHHHHHSLLKRHLSDTPPSTLTSSLFLKPTTTTTTTATTSLSHSCSTTAAAAFSISSTTSSSSTPSTSQAISFDLLRDHLSTQNFRQADDETRRLLILLAGEASQKRGYVFFSEVQFISDTDLKAIDKLWRDHSNNKFGYSVQKRIFEQKSNKDFSKFFINVGWMKKLDSEVQQYNYRAFPTEFQWELTDDTPEGHLPLTNALRGTQLLNSILNHPAFDSIEEEEGKGKEEEGGEDNGEWKGLRETVFKPNYSF